MRHLAYAAGLFLALTGLASAQTYATPNDLLTAFYKPYFDGEFYDDETPFRSSYLEGLYQADSESTPAGEMGALSFDPYIDGQDYELTDFVIEPAAITGETATVAVKFNNFETPIELTYELVDERGGWRINDVVSDNPDSIYRLSEIFTGLEASPDSGTEDGSDAD